MKKLLLILFTISLCFNVFSQDSTYTYEKYGIINQYTNNMVLGVNDILRFSKHKLKNENCFIININDLSSSSEDSAGFVLIIALKNYDELNEQYVYIGDAIEAISEKESLIYKGKCLVKSKNKLDIFLNNQGSDYKGIYYDNELSFSVNFYNMKTDQKGYIPQIPNKFIRIFPIRNKTEQEKKEEALKEKQKQEYEKREIEEIKLILDEVDIEKKISNIKNDMIKSYLQKTKDIILNTPIEQLIKDNKERKKNAFLNYNFELRIDSNKNVNIFKDKCRYEFSYYDYNRNKPFGDYKEKKLSTFELSLKDKCRNKYYLNNFNCCKIGNDIFIEDCGFSYKFIFETDIIGVKVKGDNLKYYSNENRISQFEKVHDWCSKNITQNGFYFIHYILIDEELICRNLDLDKTQKKDLNQYLKRGLLNKLND